MMRPALLFFAALFGLLSCSKTAPEERNTAATTECDPKVDLEYCVFLPLIDRLTADPAREHEAFARLSVGERALYATWILVGEVNNGGFNQYFFNTGGVFAQAAADGYRLFKAPKHVELVEKAVALFRADQARIAKVKAKGSLKAFSESYDSDPYDSLDQAFFKLSPPSEQRIAYINQHLDLFPGLKK